MKILRYSCVSGISGDMNLSALIDLGVDVAHVICELKKLNVQGWNLSAKKSQKNGIWGTQVNVDCVGGTHHHHHEAEHQHSDLDHHDHSHHHHHHHGRSFSDIKALIESSSLSDFVKQKSVKIFEKLAIAEAKIHNKNVADVHFHEVGAVDSIVDIVGGVICLDKLGVEKISVGTIELGGGVVKCEHGVMPVPAPATSVLSEGFECSLGGVNHEATTPTGMAFLATMADKQLTSVSGKVVASGIGIGQRDCIERANVLQVSLIETSVQTSQENMYVLSANIDDMTSEEIAHLCKCLFNAGCVDVWQRPIVMKKSRMAVEVCVLVAEQFKDNAVATFFANSTTLGVRAMTVLRDALKREIINFNSSLGQVRIKRAVGIDRIKAEFDDIERLANDNAMTFSQVKERVEAEFKNSGF